MGVENRWTPLLPVIEFFFGNVKRFWTMTHFMNDGLWRSGDANDTRRVITDQLPGHNCTGRSSDQRLVRSVTDPELMNSSTVAVDSRTTGRLGSRFSLIAHA